jgi:hypothetical protein
MEDVYWKKALYGPTGHKNVKDPPSFFWFRR